MAQDLGYDIQSNLTISGLFGSNLTAGSEDLSDTETINATNVVPLAVGFYIKIVTGTGTPDGTKSARVSIRWSLDGTNFDDADNEQVIARVQTPAASSTYIRHVVVPAGGKAYKINVLNDQSSGPDFTTSSAIEQFNIYGNQV